MHNVYVYRKHLRFMSKLMIGLLAFDLILILTGVIIQEEFLMVLGGVFTLYSLLMMAFFRRFNTSSFLVTDDYVHFINNKKDQKVMLEDIERVATKSIKNTGGWLEIHPKEGKTIKMTVVVENIAQFMIDLKTALEAKGLEHVFNEEKLFKFFKTANYADTSWERAYYFYKWVSVNFLAHLGLSFIFMFALQEEMMFPLVFFALTAILLVYVVVELAVFAKRNTKDSDEVRWELPKYNFEADKKILRKVLFVQGALIVSSPIILLFL